MLFNSIEFAIFLPVVFCLYWSVAGRSVRVQNQLILIASYFFYGWWDWRFLSLIMFSSLVDYWVGIGLGITGNKSKRKVLLWASILVNIGCLAFFKYFNFFADNFYTAFTLIGQPISDPVFLNLILPIGISFYTFQTLSYSIDVYHRKLEPTRDMIAFFAFVGFFPQLVAGPIERAKNLLPQFFRKRTFKYDAAVDGMRQILWGLFKKIVIADNCAVYVNDIFTNYANYQGSDLLIGGILFAFQIYGDFSGYSDIAIGTSRLFGFNLQKNFAYPYFSRDIAEFWRRWHISLSTWFRDYIYIPLGGSRENTVKKIRNILIIFLVSGLWHGANWTFIFWGLLNAIYFLPLLLTDNNRKNMTSIAKGKILPGVNEFLQIIFTFSLTTISWIFFRADTLKDAFSYLIILFSKSLFALPNISGKKDLVFLAFFLLLLNFFEWVHRNKNHGLEFDNHKIPVIQRWACYTMLVFLIVVYGGKQNEFIYFQF